MTKVADVGLRRRKDTNKRAPSIFFKILTDFLKNFIFLKSLAWPGSYSFCTSFLFHILVSYEPKTKFLLNQHPNTYYRSKIYV